MTRYKKAQAAEVEAMTAAFQRKIASLQKRVAEAKQAGPRAEMLEKSLKEATDMIRSQEARC
jgi:hypothetical protein